MEKQQSVSTFNCIYFRLGKFTEANRFVFQFENQAEVASGSDLVAAFERYNADFEKNPHDLESYKKLAKYLEPFVKANPDKLDLSMKLMDRYFEEKNAEAKENGETTQYGIVREKLDELKSAPPDVKAGEFVEVFFGLVDRYMEEAARKAGDKDKMKYISLLPKAMEDFSIFVDRVSSEYPDADFTFLTTSLQKLKGEFGEKLARNLKIANEGKREREDEERRRGEGVLKQGEAHLNKAPKNI